jgi:predicted CoA-substrate-specific enzyme activase
VTSGAETEGTIDPERASFCGVDVGASATKLVLLRADGSVAGRAVHPSGVHYEKTALACLREALTEAGAAESDIARTVSTGYGRGNVTFADTALTEIHCHGLGCHHHIPGAITIVDIGGQDNKVIRLDERGRRADFRMNRKCAAGTGAFLEEIALRLALDVAEMDPLARRASEAVRLSSFCTVFAKTEILGHLRAGVPVEQIVRGAFLSVVTRVMEMAPLDGDVVMTGGVVAHNPTVVEILSARLGQEVRVPPHPQFTGALGAALAARNQALRPSDAEAAGGGAAGRPAGPD